MSEAEVWAKVRVRAMVMGQGGQVRGITSLDHILAQHHSHPKLVICKHLLLPF